MGTSNGQFAVAIHALTALGYLHKQGVDRVTSLSLATSVGTNPVVIRSLLCDLKTAGLIASKEGKEGGFFLAKPTSKISLRDIYRAIHKEDRILETRQRAVYAPCPVSRGIKRILGPLFDEVEGVVEKKLSKTTLESLINKIDS